MIKHTEVFEYIGALLLIVATLVLANIISLQIFFDFFKQEEPDYLNPVVKQSDFVKEDDCLDFKLGIFLCTDGSEFSLDELKELRESENIPNIKGAEAEFLKTWTGTASYYSRAGCVGCHPQMIMANGEPLRDDAMTVAFNKAPLGSKLLISNLSNEKSVEVLVTDTGGFERLNRILDMTEGVKNVLGCSDLCDVSISLLDK